MVYSDAMKGSHAKASSSFSWAAFQSHIRYLGTEEQKKVHEAFELGAKMHEGQLRKSGEPYFTHPIAVAHILADMGGDADTIIVALLHDALEDTDLSEDEIEEKFGKNVQRMIDALTKLEDADLSEQPTLTGQIETIRKLFTFMQEDVRIMVIKLVDRLHNMQTIEFLSEEKRRALAQETQDVYVKIADRLSLQDLRDELAELCHGVLTPELLQGMLKIRSESERRAQRIIGEMKKAIALVQGGSRVELLYEPSRFRKLQRLYEAGGSTVTGVSPFSIVFICADTATCYQTLGALHQCWQREVLSFQDFINAPMINNYRGLHTTMILEDGTRVRCKIRTREMHEYARRGIATMCFQNRPMGLPSFLGWSKRISPLSERTSERSEDFWESLQSDILGESIVIYGPGDQTILLPEGATALDGAFYFFSEKALRLRSVKIDGREVSFQAPLTNATSLDVEFSKHRTFSREWLAFVKTGLASSVIRDGLTERSRGQKVEEGRSLLDANMKEKKKGFLAEFKEEYVRSKVATVGFSSLEEALIAIAEGKVEASQIANAILLRANQARPTRRTPDTSTPKRYKVSFDLPNDNIGALRQLVDIYDEYRSHIHGIRIYPLPFVGKRRYVFNAVFSEKEREDYKSAVTAIVGDKVSVIQTSEYWWLRLALPLLIVLWSLDCLVAKMIVDAGASPYDLTVLRFGILLMLSTGYFASSRLTPQGKESSIKLISPFDRALLVSVIGLFCTAFFTYLALQSISVISYAVFITFGTVLAFMPSLKGFERSHRTFLFLLSTIVLGISSLLVLFQEEPFHSLGPWAGLGAGLSFALYSLASTRYQLEHSIRSRYPIFVFFLALFSFVLSLPLLFLSGFSLLSSPLLLPAILFLTLLTSSPYALYYQLLKRQGVAMTGHVIPLFFPLVVLGQFMISGEWTWLSLLPIAASIGWAFSYRRESETV